MHVYINTFASPFLPPKFVPTTRVSKFEISGEGKEEFAISHDGWLYLEKPLDWSQEDHYVMTVTWLHPSSELQQLSGVVELTVASASRSRHWTTTT